MMALITQRRMTAEELEANEGSAPGDIVVCTYFIFTDDTKQDGVNALNCLSAALAKTKEIAPHITTVRSWTDGGPHYLCNLHYSLMDEVARAHGLRVSSYGRYVLGVEHGSGFQFSLLMPSLLENFLSIDCVLTLIHFRCEAGGGKSEVDGQIGVAKQSANRAVNQGANIFNSATFLEALRKMDSVRPFGVENAQMEINAKLHVICFHLSSHCPRSVAQL